jgi:phage shock protein PspC (stress-responsive transcriptional regulator)
MSPAVNPLYRSSTDRMVAGVCGGLAGWLGWSATAVRILYVVLSILSAAFPGILVYLLLWIVMPQEGRRHGGEPLGSDLR